MSSHDFIRALKASSDPPVPNGLSKLEIASSGWKDNSLLVPRKDQVITDWIISKFHKDSASVLEPKLWELLYQIISNPQIPLKTWLPPLLNRTSLSNPLISLLGNLSDLDGHIRIELLSHACKTLSILWPFAVRKFNTEVLLECFGALVSALTNVELCDNLSQLCIWIVNSFRSSLSNSSSKKKIYTTFAQTYLISWTACLADIEEKPLPALAKAYEAGVDILFNLDILRQLNEDDKIFFDALRGAPPNILPRLFSSYITAVKHFRGALFGQGSGHHAFGGIEDIRTSALRFFLSTQSLLSDKQQENQYWNTQSALCIVIKDHALYNGQQEFQESFSIMIDNIIKTLKNHDEAESSQKAAARATETLTAIVGVEYTLLGPALPRILFHILAIPSSAQAYHTFLEAILEYHSKTRTVNEYASALLNLPLQDIRVGAGGVKETLSLSIGSPLMQPRHLDQLGRCIRSFITPTQIMPTLHMFVERLSARWGEVLAAEDSLGGHLKALKKGTSASGNLSQLVGALEASSVALSLTCRVFNTALTSLLFENSTVDVQQAYRDTLRELYDSVIATTNTIVKFLTKWSSSNSGEIWATSMATSALLRLSYGLRQRYSLRESPSTKLTSKLLVFVDENNKSPLYPELSMEIFRYFLDIVDHVDTNMCISNAINCLANLLESSTSSTEGEAFLQLLIERWLPLIDYKASPQQMESLIQILVGRSATSTNNALQRCITSADFWELQKVRESLLAYVDITTAVFKQEPANLSQPEGFEKAVAVFDLLLSFPPDYFPRHLKADMLKRASTADIIISASLETTCDMPALEMKLSVVRTFTLRMMSHLGTVDRPIETIPALLKHLLVVQTTNTTLTDATLNLVRFYLSATLQGATAPPLKQLISTIDVKPKADLFAKGSVNALYLQSLIEILTRERTPASFTDASCADLRSLYSELVDELMPRVASIASAKASNTRVEQGGLLQGWKHVLILGRWLGVPTNGTSVMYGPRLVLQCIQADEHVQTMLVEASFSVLKEECLSQEVDHRNRLLEVLLEGYVSLLQSETPVVDGLVSEVIHRLSAEEYTLVTKSVEEKLLEDGHKRTRHRIVSLAALMLQNNPRDTFQHSQAFATMCLTTFGKTTMLCNSSVRTEVCRLALYRCREKAAILRSVDVNAIWSIISSLLSGSQTHEEHTSTHVFHDIIAIMTALVRHRRDLVLQSLPHLGQALRKLLLLLRRSKAQLGGQHSSILSDNCPVWWNARDPLDVEEAKALSRLLESLLSKTIIRTYSTGSEGPKAESLSKPFSKHAAFVLTAYIEAATNPLCVVPTSVHKELQPGLFALCAIVNEHDRNALMVASLDAEGKLVMKALWKDYDKQRYVGRG